MDGGGPVDAMRRPLPAEGLQRPDFYMSNSFGLMHVAVACEQLEMLKMLLDRGASVDLRTSIGSTPLMTAAGAGYLDIVRELLQHSANPDAQDIYGYTALKKAAYFGQEECVKALL